MKTSIFLVVVFICQVFGDFPPDLTEYAKEYSLSEDAKLETPGLLEKYGYPHESHTVTTSDGYILTMHRIMGGRKAPLDPSKPPVFLMHGILCSSGDWILMGTDNGLGYILADKGYDVWMGNARGNRYSRKHKKYNPDKMWAKFWDFSWNEIGYYDLPAMIDYVLSKTKKDKLHYIGHSQGTTSFFVMASSLPKYNDKILTMNALAPIAHMKHLKSPVVQFMSPFVFAIEAVTKVLGIGEFLPNNTLINDMGGLLCSINSPFSTVCTNTLFLTCGYDSELLNTTMLPVIMGHTPAGSSIKQFFHYGQEHIDLVFNNFKKYDYLLLNPLHYKGSPVAPSYKLSKITSPIYLHYGDNDWMAGVKDVKKLAGELKNSEVHRVDFKKFNHLDFLYAINIRYYVYDKVLDILEKKENEVI